MTVREMLFENQDVKYGDFHSKLIPGIDRGEIIGVRLPVIRKIAKKAALDDLEINTFYYEEKMINGMVIEYNKKLSLDERFALLDDFVPLIENYSTVIEMKSNGIIKINDSELRITKNKNKIQWKKLYFEV